MSYRGKRALVPMINGSEIDFMGKGHAKFYRFSSGYRKWLKRGYNGRVRRAGRKEADDQGSECDCSSERIDR